MSFEKPDPTENNSLEKITEKSPVQSTESSNGASLSPGSSGAKTEKGRSRWEEYLDRTGNPMLQEMKREAGVFAQRGSVGNLEGLKNLSPQGQEALKQSQERQMNLAADFLFDATASDQLLESATYTGNINVDAENLFQSIHAQRALTRLQSGEDPRALLSEAVRTADTLSANIKNNEALQKSAYTIIKIRGAIERILNESK